MKILLAEGDAILANTLTAELRRAEFTVKHAPSGPVAEYLLMKQPFDLVILDLDLPMLDGLTVLKRLRAVIPSLSVMVLTAMDGHDGRVAGLNAGADDYIPKPFEFPALEARLRALLRRAQPAAAALEAEHGRLTVVHAARRASIDGVALDLSPREWTLLDLLVTNRDRVVTKEQIAQAWGTDGTKARGGNSTAVYVHRLRRKLEGSALVIRRVHGIGYVLEAKRR